MRYVAIYRDEFANFIVRPRVCALDFYYLKPYPQQITVNVASGDYV